MSARDPMQLDLLIRSKLKERSKRSKVRAALADNGWHLGANLERIGGRRFGVRVQEIREGSDGYPPARVVVMRDGASGDSTWRFTCLCRGEATCAACAEFRGQKGGAPRHAA